MIFFLRRYSIVFCLFNFLLFAVGTEAQTLSGRVTGPEKQALAYSSIELMSMPDSLVVKTSRSDSAGRFQMSGMRPGQYLLAVRNLYYATEWFQLKLDSGKNINREFRLTDKVDVLKGGGARIGRDPVRQMNDTVEYSASNYKVNQDASADNLVSKMPGITIDNGTLKAQGEEIRKVTVDGQDFFGDDAQAALKNLPAEVIDKVQVFDRQSDQSQFSGVDDGNSQKTLNIVTKSGKNNGQFGKIYGGYGTDERWAAGTNINIFKGAHRVSLIGMSNNINQQNFSTQDILGLTGSSQQGGSMRFGGRPGGYRGMGDLRNFLVGQQEGINTTHAFGLNYSMHAGKKFKMTASYFLNRSSNETSSFLSRTYFLSSLDNQLYTQGDTGTSVNMNHRFNARVEFMPDSMNSIIFTPSLRLQSFSGNTVFFGLTNTQELQNLNNSRSITESATDGFSYSQDLLLRHRFKKVGHTISLNLEGSVSNNTGNTALRSGNNYFVPVYVSEQFNQNTENDGRTLEFSPDLSYTHPLSRRSFVELTYNPEWIRNSSDRITNRQDTLTGIFDMTDTLLSSRFRNNTNTQSGGVTYRYRHDKISFNLGANLQQVELIGKQSFPRTSDIRVPFRNILPNALFTYARNKNSNLRIHYRSRTELPQASQLQDVVNNSNPLILSAGNPGLVQEVRHFVFMRYSVSNVKKGRTFHLFSRLSTISNYIGNSTILASSDTMAGAVQLRRDAQLTLPVNINGYRSGGVYLSYGVPLKKIKTVMNLTAGENITRSPALINGKINYNTTFATNAGIVLASNISENIDYTLTFNASHNQVQNSIQSELNNTYLIRNFNARINYLPVSRVVFSADITNSAYSGLGTGFNQNIWLCNGGVGYKFMKDRRGELRLSVFDALKQNTSINRNVTESYIEDKNTVILTRFYMLTFTYNIRHFGTAPPAQKQNGGPGVQPRH